jgi:hypothetical protein
MRETIIVLCMVGILLGVLLTLPVDARPGLDDIRAKHEPKLIATQGISAVASDKAKNEIVVYAETQKDCEKLPQELDGVKVRCEVIGRVEALQPAAVATQPTFTFPSYPSSQRYSRTGTDRPVFGGISLGSAAFSSSAGTLGLVTSSGQILSCAHVEALDSNCNYAQIGTAIWQPGGYDRGSASSSIGTLQKYSTIAFNDDGATNYADAAYGTLSTNVAYKADMVLNAANTGWVTIGSTGTAKQADIVSKSGRTTGLTTGTVSQTGVTVKVSYWNGKYAVFKDQLAISNRGYQQFCKAGDSGSVVYENGQFVGLLFAASSNQYGSTTMTFANTAAHVMTSLGLSKI